MMGTKARHFAPLIHVSVEELVPPDHFYRHQAGLVWGRELYIDGTKVEANASKESLTPRFAVEAHLANLFEPEAQEPAQETEHTPSPETVPPANWEPDEFPRRARRKNYRPSVAVASLIARGALRVFVEPQKYSLFLYNSG